MDWRLGREGRRWWGRGRICVTTHSTSGSKSRFLRSGTHAHRTPIPTSQNTDLPTSHVDRVYALELKEEELGAADADDSRSIQTIIPHELKRVNEEDED
jgi:hypothetical protein